LHEYTDFADNCLILSSKALARDNISYNERKKKCYISQETHMTIKTLNHKTAISASPSPETLPVSCPKGCTQQHVAIDKCAELATLVERHTSSERSGYYETAIDHLVFVRCNTSKTIQEVSEPLVGIVVQGQKKLSVNEEIFQYGIAQYLVMSVDLPLSVCMIEATPEQPYLGLKLKLDLAQLCEIITQTNPDIDKKENSERGWCVSDANPSLIDCAIRLTKLLETPQDIPFLAPMIIREIYYRLLTDKQGEAVRQIATSGSNMQRIAEVIKQIKAEFSPHR
jgi:AraC-type transcriptional regulator N-terminus